MEKRLVYAEDVIDEIDKWLGCVGYATVGKHLSYYGELLGCIKDAPTVDAAPVVRCKDCRHCESYYPEKAIGEEYYPPEHRCMMLNRVVRPEHFCSYGERKGIK